MDRVDVLLTCDRTLMSNHHGKEFLGFGTTSPPNWLPEWLYRYLFFPKIKKVNGLPWQAPYGLRKIEAKLIDAGIDALVVDPMIWQNIRQRLLAYMSWILLAGVHHQQLLLE